MRNKLRLYLKAAFCELLITLIYLLVVVRPFIGGEFFGYSLKQVFVLSFILILVSIIGFLMVYFMFWQPGKVITVIDFFRIKRKISWIIVAISFMVLVGTVILIVMHNFYAFKVPGGFYTLAIMPTICLICIQTIVLFGEIAEMRTIQEITRIGCSVWSAIQRLGTRIWEFICKNNITRGKVPQVIENTLYVFIPLCLFFGLFDDPLRLPFGLDALDFRYGYFEVVGFVFILLYLAFLLPGWLGKLAGLSIVLFLFGLPLSGIWESVYNESTILRGLIPWNDANGYYQDARRLLNGELISQFSARRPLFSGLLSVLLGLTEQNLRVTSIILVGITTISCYFSGREVQRTHGSLAAALYLSILFFFYRRFTGTTLTEHLGLAMSALGFALLWRGASAREGKMLLSGLFLITLALNARSGAYFTLPLVIIWIGWLFRGKRWFSAAWIGYATAAVTAGFAINFILLRILAVQGGSINSNFSYTLYGLVSGGESWHLVVDEHPEINNLDEPELSQRIYELAYERWRQHPDEIIYGTLKAFDFFTRPQLGLFSFIRSGFSETGIIPTHYILLILSGFGALVFLFQRQDTRAVLLGFYSLGVLISVPFVPPWDAEYMRVYAASMPFLAALPIMGLVFLLDWSARRFKVINILTRPQDVVSSQMVWIFSVILVVFTIIGAVSVRIFSRRTEFADFACPPDSITVYTRSSPGSYLTVWDDSTLTQSWVPDVRYGNFIGGHNLDFPFPETLTELASIKPDTTIINSYDLKTGLPLIIFSDLHLVPSRNTILAACGQWSESAVPKQNGFFYAHTIEDVKISKRK